MENYKQKSWENFFPPASSYFLSFLFEESKERVTRCRLLVLFDRFSSDPFARFTIPISPSAKRFLFCRLIDFSLTFVRVSMRRIVGDDGDEG
jgi:hypothetical protein